VRGFGEHLDPITRLKRFAGQAVAVVGVVVAAAKRSRPVFINRPDRKAMMKPRSIPRRPSPPSALIWGARDFAYAVGVIAA
jgi:hypothetical protein